MKRRALSWATLVLLLAAHTLYQSTEAAHVAPLVRDISMGNIAAGERELSIAIDPANPNRMMGGSNQRPGTQSWFASVDGGRTWTNGALPNGTLTVAGTTSTLMSDPSLMYGNDGTLYYSALMHGGSGEPCTLFVTTTTDQGANWTDPANGVVAVAGGDCQDKEHIFVDQANNNVYAAWTPIGATNNQEVVFSRDLGGVGNGFAFSAPAVITTDAAFNGCLNQGAEFAMTGTRLYLTWTSFCSGFGHGDAASVWVTFSDNQGAAWSAPVQVGTLDNVDFSAQGFRSRSFPSIDADPGGRVFVVWASNTDGGGNDDGDVYITSSADGTTWTAAAVVNAEPGGGDEDEQWMPWVSVGQGRVHVVYYCWDDEGTSINACFAYGDVAATPAFTEVVLSSAVTPTGTGFIGDYNGSFVGSDDVAHPAWGDGRATVGGSTDAFTARVDFSPPTLVSVSGPASLPWGQSATFTATVTGAHGEDEQFIPVAFTVAGGGLPFPSSSLPSPTNAAGEVSFTFSNGVASTNTVTAWADLNENGVQDGGETGSASITWTKHPTTTTYTEPSSGTYSDPVTFFGTLVDALTNGALAGETLTFAVGGDSCSGVTDAFGIASCTTALTSVPGLYTATATFAGSSQYEGSSGSAPFEVLKETTVLTYTGPTLVANNLPITLSAVLTEDDGPAVVGRTVSLTLGSGGSAQTCAGVTNAGGVASCTIPLVNQPLGPGVVSADFAGDAYYLPSSDSDSIIVFQWTTGGNFVIGDGNAAIGSTATFWGSQWSQANTVSGGPTPDSFKGFSIVPSGPTTCGGTFDTTGGNSPPPPEAVPSYTAILVTSSVVKSGNTISGTKPAIVVVRTNPGYGPSPGHAGTAEVLAVLCSL